MSASGHLIVAARVRAALRTLSHSPRARERRGRTGAARRGGEISPRCLSFPEHTRRQRIPRMGSHETSQLISSSFRARRMGVAPRATFKLKRYSALVAQLVHSSFSSHVQHFRKANGVHYSNKINGDYFCTTVFTSKVKNYPRRPTLETKL